MKNSNSITNLPQRPSSGLSSNHSGSSGSGRFNRYGTYSGSQRKNLNEKNPTIEKISGCAHFHYDFVELAPLTVTLLSDGCFEISEENEQQSSPHKFNPNKNTFEVFRLQITCNIRTWIIERSTAEIIEFDKQIHRCVYDRRYSNLKELINLSQDVDKRRIVTDYFARFSVLAGSLITCYPVLKWLELDNRGNRLMPAEETPINTPGRAAAYVVREYTAHATDELTLKLGDIVSVIDMPPASESIWWKGKLTIVAQSPLIDLTNISLPSNHKAHALDEERDCRRKMFEVGFFPSHCVQLFGSRMRWLPDVLKDSAASKPVFHKRGKVLTFLRGFLLNRPQRRRLKEAGVLRERVFGCDLGEHLLNTGLNVPTVLTTCANFIEEHGLVDGIYRLSGAVSNINRLRNIFDCNSGKAPVLDDEVFLQDVHCVASLLKMYFRELPNPLFTYQLYNSFVEAVEGIGDRHKKILKLHEVVTKLPPPHFRTAEYLLAHLSKVGDRGHRTGMHHQNLAIVWAPNLFRCREIEGELRDSTSHVLKSVNTQAVITEYLIRYCHIIFSHNIPANKSQSTNININDASYNCTGRKSRPRSMIYSTDTPSKLINLEEAQAKLMAARHEKVPATAGLPDLTNRKCIDVNGGPDALPQGYHTVIELHKRNRPSRGWRSFFPSRQIVTNHRPNPMTDRKPYTLPRRESSDTGSGSDSLYGTMQHVKGWDVRRSSKRKQTEKEEKDRRRRPHGIRPTTTASTESLMGMLPPSSATESGQASPITLKHCNTSNSKDYEERAIDIGPHLASQETLGSEGVRSRLKDDSLTPTRDSRDSTPMADPRMELFNESRISAPASITLKEFADLDRAQSQPPYIQDMMTENIEPNWFGSISQDPIRIMVNEDPSLDDSQDYSPSLTFAPLSPDQYFSESEALRVSTSDRYDCMEQMNPSPCSDPENYCCDANVQPEHTIQQEIRGSDTPVEGNMNKWNSSSIEELLGKTVHVSDETMERSDFVWDYVKDISPNQGLQGENDSLKDENLNEPEVDWTNSKLYEVGEEDKIKESEVKEESHLLEKLKSNTSGKEERGSGEWANQDDLRKYMPELANILDAGTSDQELRSSPALAPSLTQSEPMHPSIQEGATPNIDGNLLKVNLPIEAEELLKSMESGLEQPPPASPRSFDEVTASIFGENCEIDCDSLQTINGITRQNRARSQERETSDESDLSHSRYDNLSASSPSSVEEKECSPMITHDCSPMIDQDCSPMIGQDCSPMSGQDCSPMIGQDCSPILTHTVMSTSVSHNENLHNTPTPAPRRYGSLADWTNCIKEQAGRGDDVTNGMYKAVSLEGSKKGSISNGASRAKQLIEELNMQKTASHQISRKIAIFESQNSVSDPHEGCTSPIPCSPIIPPTPTPRLSKGASKRSNWKDKFEVEERFEKKPNELLDSPLFKRQRDALASPRKPGFNVFRPKGKSEPPPDIQKKSTHQILIDTCDTNFEFVEGDRPHKFPTAPPNTMENKPKANAVYYV